VEAEIAEVVAEVVMRFDRHAYLRSVAALIIMISAAGCTQQTSVTMQVISQKSAVSEGIFDNATESPLLELIAEAQKTIDIEIYEIGDPDVRAGLVDAAARGVVVRMVVEPSPVGVGCNVLADDGEPNTGCARRRSVMAEFRDAGIELYPFEKALCGAEGNNCLQHGKLLIADRQIAMMSSGNFNSSSICNLSVNPAVCNRDYSVVTKDAKVVRALHKIFEKDVAGVPYDLEAILTAEIRRKLTVSPHAQKDILNFIKSAKTSISIQNQYLREPLLNVVLIAAADRGVQVEVTLASNCSFTTFLNDNTRDRHRSFYEPLIAAGVDLRFYTKLNQINGRSGYLHSKLIIADDSRAWVGSINGSASGFSTNREFGMFVDDEASIQKVIQIFADDHHSDVNEELEDNLTCKGERVQNNSMDVNE